MITDCISKRNIETDALLTLEQCEQFWRRSRCQNTHQWHGPEIKNSEINNPLQRIFFKDLSCHLSETNIKSIFHFSTSTFSFSASYFQQSQKHIQSTFQPSKTFLSFEQCTYRFILPTSPCNQPEFLSVTMSPYSQSYFQ